ncbi:MAG: hypothetical protein Aurels2KO_33810 [Aureliella sp.]
MTATLGFLTVRRHAEHGYFGGYLVVNEMARPLEFQCTLPVKPSRAQQVLYGPTLDDFICGEQIAKALVTKAKLTPDLVVADSRAVLAMSNVSKTPIAIIDQAGQAFEHKTLHVAPESKVMTTRVHVDGLKLLAPAGSTIDEAFAAELYEKLHPSFDFDEPFQRIIEALAEAHPVTNAA